MRVEITEGKLKDADPDTKQHYALVRGDVVTVSDACGKRWCDLGWARDLAPTKPYPSQPRQPGMQEIRVPKTKVGAAAKVK